MTQYTQIDAFILDAIKHKRNPLYDKDTHEESTRLATSTGRLAFRIIDSRLQAMKRQNQIEFITKTEAKVNKGPSGWQLTGSTKSEGLSAPSEENSPVFDEVRKVLDILKAAGVATEANDKITAIVQALCEEKNASKVWRNAIKQKLMTGRPEFGNKVIQGVGKPCQVWISTLSFSIPLKCRPVNKKFINTDVPSMDYEAAIDKWLDEVDATTTNPKLSAP